MRKIFQAIVLIFLLIGFTQCKVPAGGPLVVKSGMAITYGTRPFLYRYDQGPLGMYSNSEAIALTEALFMDWESVPTAKIDFKQDTPSSLNSDITVLNYDPILNTMSLLGYTPIIFDHDGSIVDSFLGSGSNNSVLGFAGPVTTSSGPLAGQIAESQAVFNGRFVNGTNTASDKESSVDAFKGTIIHEVGHGIGLDHSQINVEALQKTTPQSIRDLVPLEFPVAVNDLFIIRRDDISSISLLYPNTTELSMYGEVTGRVFASDGMTPFLGANVILRNITNPKLEAISCVSDFLADNTGTFRLVAVPSGSYKVEVEPIDISFTGPSGVGPYAMDASDKSFLEPVTKGFYTGVNMPLTDDENKALVLNVQTGQTISNINIISATQLDDLGGLSSSGGDDLGLSSSSSGGDSLELSSSSSSSSGTPVVTTSSSGGTMTGVISTSSSSGVIITTQLLEILGPETLNLKPKKKNIIKLIASSLNFATSTLCQVFTSQDSLVKIKPREFILSKLTPQKIIRVTVPKPIAVGLITASTSKTLTINVTCKNGTTDEFDLIISP